MTPPVFGNLPVILSVPSSSSAAPASEERAIAIADQVIPLLPPDDVTEEYLEIRKKGWRALCSAGGLALGVTLALALTGVMIFSNPVGWAVGGALLLAGLIGSAAYGGRKELVKSLEFGVRGLAVGFLLTYGGITFFAATDAAKAIVLAIAAAGLFVYAGVHSYRSRRIDPEVLRGENP